MVHMCCSVYNIFIYGDCLDHTVDYAIIRTCDCGYTCTSIHGTYVLECI